MTVHPSCYRIQSKRDRTPTPERFKQWWMKAYTPQEIIDKIRALPDDKYLDGWFRMMPKQIQADVNSTFQLIINGLPIKSIDSKEVKGQLVEHQDDDD